MYYLIRKAFSCETERHCEWAISLLIARMARTADAFVFVMTYSRVWSESNIHIHQDDSTPSINFFSLCILRLPLGSLTISTNLKYIGTFYDSVFNSYIRKCANFKAIVRLRMRFSNRIALSIVIITITLLPTIHCDKDCAITANCKTKLKWIQAQYLYDLYRTLSYISVLFITNSLDFRNVR